MGSFLIWFVVVELLGLAALPLALATLPHLADRGYGLAKILGLLLATFLNYLLGSLFGLGNNGPVLALLMIGVFAGGAFLLRGELHTLGDWFATRRSLIVIEEAIFLLLFAAWALFRANHPGLLSTEKPMDLALMTASHKATSFPPYDPWLSGTTINYYYGGYLAAGTLVTLTGAAPAVGYNLAVALLFGLIGVAAYSVAFGLTRSWRWAFLGPLFVLLIGNLDGLSQLLSNGTTGFDFFRSSRIVEAHFCGGSSCTITEFPAFSFLLGDLHPHVIALPFTILSIGLALNLALAPAAGWAALAADNARRVLTILLAGMAVGALYFMNSWDWPTYLLLCMVALFVPGLRSPESRRLGEAAGLAVAVALLSYVLYLSFRLNFAPQYSSFGLSAHGSAANEVFIMFGLFLLPVLAFVVTRFAQSNNVPASAAEPAPAVAAAVGAPAVPARSTPAPTRRGGRTALLEREDEDEEIVEEDEEADDDLPLLPMPHLGRSKRRKPAQNRRQTQMDDHQDDQYDKEDAIDGSDELPDLPTLSLPRIDSWSGALLALVAAAVVLRLVLGAVAGLGTIGLWLPVALVALYLAWRAARAGDRHEAMALLLCAGGLGLVMLCDLLYLKDNFYGTDATGTPNGLYRMNTVFKFYYQAWTLLALGGAYGLYYLSTKLRVNWQRFVAPAFAAILVVAGGVYMAVGIFTPTTAPYTQPVAHAATLDGMALLDNYAGQPISITNAIPNDAIAMRWLTQQVGSGHPTILEADQVGNPPGPQDYWRYPGDSEQELMMSRISVFTGLPAVLGWGYSHEGLWHGDAIVSKRFSDVQTMYTSTDPTIVGNLLRQYNVRYIYVGQIEAYTYYNDDRERLQTAIDRLKRFGTVVYNVGGVTIIKTNFAS